MRARQRWGDVLGWQQRWPASLALGADGNIYFGIDHALVAVNSDGKEKWRYKVEDVAALSPIVGADGTIYVITDAGVTALSPDGQEKWTVTGISAYGTFLPSISADSQLYVP